MASLTEGRPAASFIISEANGHRSRAKGTAGAALTAGTVLEANTAGELIAFDGTGTVAGIAITDAADGDTVAYIIRDAEVNGNVLTYPTESTAGGEEAASNAGLLTLGIVVR